jgi:RNA polymerase sigma-70 factor (ECF subfamily)
MPEEPEFAEFYAATYQRLTAQLSLYAGNMTEAQEVVQEAMVRALARWPAISRYDDPAAWVRKVAWNLATSRWRKIKRLISLAEWHAEPQTPPDVDTIAIQRGLAKLPPQQRKAMILHYLMDMPIAEVATECGVAEGTVKSWLHRARTAMASHIPNPRASEVDSV